MILVWVESGLAKSNFEEHQLGSFCLVQVWDNGCPNLGSGSGDSEKKTILEVQLRGLGIDWVWE